MTILVGLLLGIGLGYALRRREWLIRFSGRIMGWAVYLLLFLLGLSVGDNQALLQALPQLGGQALLLAVGAVSGSLLLLFPLATWLDIAHEK